MTFGVLKRRQAHQKMWLTEHIHFLVTIQDRGVGGWRGNSILTQQQPHIFDGDVHYSGGHFPSEQVTRIIVSQSFQVSRDEHENRENGELLRTNVRGQLM